MALDPESRYLQLGQLIAEMPDLEHCQITPEVNRWLGRAAYLVGENGDGILNSDAIMLKSACDGLNSSIRPRNAQQIASIVFRTLASAEAKAPASAQGAFIAAGAHFDAFQVIAKVLADAKRDVLIVDPYMDSKVFTDFISTAPEGIAIRLFADRENTKPDALQAPTERWAQQFGAKRPLEVRLSARKALHDRLILVDDTISWALSQSLKDFVGRSPASVLRMPQDIGDMKIAHYNQEWGNATPIV